MMVLPSKDCIVEGLEKEETKEQIFLPLCSALTRQQREGRPSLQLQQPEAISLR